MEIEQLSPHFAKWEFEKSEYAQRQGIDNTIPKQYMYNAKLVAELMEKVRDLLGDKPIIVNSCYRNPVVNNAVGGARASEHLKAMACDFICPQFGTPLEIAKKIASSDLQYGQLIQEGTWVHISLPVRFHRENLTMKKGKYFKGIV